MSWNSSVGVMQMISRELLLCKGIPGSLELHKGRAVPGWFTRVLEGTSPTRAWWQVYLDNFMAAERVSGEYQGLDVAMQSAAMRAWGEAGVLIAELPMQQSWAPDWMAPEDCWEPLPSVSSATLQALLREGASSKEGQIVLGRWVFILQFRRQAMGVLSKAWNALDGRWPSRRQRQDLLRELEMLL